MTNVHSKPINIFLQKMNRNNIQIQFYEPDQANCHLF